MLNVFCKCPGSRLLPVQCTPQYNFPKIVLSLHRYVSNDNKICNNNQYSTSFKHFELYLENKYPYSFKPTPYVQKR